MKRRQPSRFEACCDPAANPGAYPFSISERDTCLQIDPRPLFMALAQDLRKAVSTNIISRRFHSGLVDALSEAALKIAKKTRLKQVCLSGGSFQNAFLSISLEQSLTRLGLNVFVHKQVPPGDGGLSLGQLVIAANQ
jgi:hydrogenase maturation protein HypF